MGEGGHICPPAPVGPPAAKGTLGEASQLERPRDSARQRADDLGPVGSFIFLSRSWAEGRRGAGAGWTPGEAGREWLRSWCPCRTKGETLQEGPHEQGLGLGGSRRTPGPGEGWPGPRLVLGEVKAGVRWEEGPEAPQAGLLFLSPSPRPPYRRSMGGLSLLSPLPPSQPHSASPPVHSNAGPLAPHPPSPVTSASVCRMVHPWPCPPDDPTPPATAMATPKPRVSNTCSALSLSQGPALSLPLLLLWDCTPVPSANHLLTIRPHTAPCPSFPPSYILAFPCLSLAKPNLALCSAASALIYPLSHLFTVPPHPHPSPFPSCLPPSTGTFKPEEAVMVASHLSPPHIHSSINSDHFVSQTHLDAQGWLSGSAQQAEEPTTP
uniref:Uncharacterized protein n=1 Tax=Myotis myotis TaxID=51298 RepID=A0A7J8ANH7_MYOMY|nr:hypothetical protein mMyoMyo1_008210 [Myotis myotis]